MIYTYKELRKQKENGNKLNWDKITKEQLEELFFDEYVSNNTIADLYDVNLSKVTSKRHKWNIKLNSATHLYKTFSMNHKEELKLLNEHSKERLCKEENIDYISKALTHYIFRNGPVEDMHANHQFSQEDMKTLNKYMVNKLAGLLKMIYDGEWMKIELLLNFFKRYGHDWDKAEIDISDFELIFKNELEKMNN